MEQRRRLLFALVVAVLVVFSDLTIKESIAQEVRVLNIGWLSSGGQILANLAAFTPNLLIPIATKHFNERSDLVLPLSKLVPETCNATIRLVYGVHDDGGIPYLALKHLFRFKNEVDIVLGPVLSAPAIPMAVGTAALGIPSLSFYASADELSDKSVYPNFFRAGASDAQTADPMATLFQQFNYKKVALVYMNNNFGLNTKTALLAGCRKRDIELMSQEYDHSLSGEALEKQVFEVVKVIKQFRLSVIIYATTRVEFIYALSKAAKELDWHIGKLFVSHLQITDTSGITPEKFQDCYRFLNGSLQIIANVDVRVPGALNLVRAWHTFNATYVNELLPQPIQIPSDFFQLGLENVAASRAWAWAYDSAIAIGLAACGGGDDDDDGNTTLNLRENLAKVDFLGTSGPFRFDANTFDRTSDGFVYYLVNLITNQEATSITQLTVGLLQGDSNWNMTKPIVFNDGGSEPPKDIDPPINEIEQVPLGAQIYAWVIGSIALLSCFLALGFVVRYRTKQGDLAHSHAVLLAHSHAVLLALLGIGCTLVAVSIFALSVESDASCMAFPWLFASGMALAMVSLGGQVARIVVSLRYRKNWSRRSQLLVNRVIPATMVVGMFGVFVILLAWQFTCPWQLMTLVLDSDSSGFPLRSSLVCASSSDTSTVIIVVLVLYLCLIGIIIACIAFWGRNASRKYHQIRMVALALIFMVQILLMAAACVYAVWQLALPRFLVLSSMSFLLCMIILISMFAPVIFKEQFASSATRRTAKTISSSSKKNTPQQQQKTNTTAVTFA